MGDITCCCLGKQLVLSEGVKTRLWCASRAALCAGPHWLRLLMPSASPAASIAAPVQCLCGAESCWGTAWHHAPQTHSLSALSLSPAQHGCPCEERKPESICGLPPVQANAVLRAGGWLGRWGGDSDRSQTFLCRVSWALPTSPSPPGCGGVPWLRHFPPD